MSMGMRFPVEMGIPWECDKNEVNCGNGEKNNITGNENELQ